MIRFGVAFLFCVVICVCVCYLLYLLFLLLWAVAGIECSYCVVTFAVWFWLVVGLDVGLGVWFNLFVFALFGIASIAWCCSHLLLACCLLMFVYDCAY